MTLGREERCHSSEAWICANIILFEKIFHWGSQHRCSLPEELIPRNEPGGGKQRSIQLYSEVPGYVFIVNRTRLLTWHWLCRHDNCNSDGVFRAWTKNLETSEVGDLCQGCISSVTLWRGHCTKLKVNLKVPWTLRVYMLWTFLLTRFCFFFCKWFVPVKYHS